MIFHVVGIKEVSKKKYNIDVLIEAQSIDFVRAMLHDYDIVLLDISEYNWDTLSFWSAMLVVSYNDQLVHIISNLSNLRMVAHKFIMMWFDVKSINFFDWRKMSDDVAMNILEMAKHDVQMEQTVNMDIWQEENQEETVYHDETLEKILAVAEREINDINEKIYTMWSEISSRDLKDIKAMEQELAKLRMWRNMDKIVDLLEKVLVKALEIKQKYLATQRSNEQIIIPWSVVTDIDVQSELNILDKAKNVEKIWKMRTFDDQFYGTFWFCGVQMKFLWKDIANKITDIWSMTSVLFDFAEYLILFMICICTFVLRYKWLWNWNEINSYLYMILIMFGIWWIVWYWISRIKKQNIVVNIILLWLWVVLSALVYCLIKYFFVL